MPFSGKGSDPTSLMSWFPRHTAWNRSPYNVGVGTPAFAVWVEERHAELLSADGKLRSSKEWTEWSRGRPKESLARGGGPRLTITLRNTLEEYLKEEIDNCIEKQT